MIGNPTADLPAAVDEAREISHILNATPFLEEAATFRNIVPMLHNSKYVKSERREETQMTKREISHSCSFID